MTTTTSTESGAAFDLALTESQELVQRTARDFAAEKLLPIARDIDAQGTVPQAILKELRSGDATVEVGLSHGARRVFALERSEAKPAPVLTAESVVVVTGGAKGLGAKFATAIAKFTTPARMTVPVDSPPDDCSDSVMGPRVPRASGC